MADTQSLLSRIEAMKKEVNDIQTIDISKLNTVMTWPE
jgi:virulence-associated protein VapD